MEVYEEQFAELVDGFSFPRRDACLQFRTLLTQKCKEEEEALTEHLHGSQRLLDDLNNDIVQHINTECNKINYAEKKKTLLAELQSLKDQYDRIKKDAEQQYSSIIQQTSVKAESMKQKHKERIGQLKNLMRRSDRFGVTVPHITGLPDEADIKIPSEFLPHLFDFQIATIHRMLQVTELLKVGILGNDVGTGKTRTALMFAAAYTLQYPGNVYIIVPSRMIYHWIEEMGKISDDSNHLADKVEMYRDLRDIKKARPNTSSKRIHVVTLSIVKMHGHCFDLDYDLLICDEMQTFIQSQRRRPRQYQHQWIISATASAAEDENCKMEVLNTLQSGFRRDTPLHVMEVPRLWMDNFTTDAMVRADAQFIRGAFEIPPILVRKMQCRGVAESLRTLMPRVIMNLINQGCMKEAIERAGGSSSSLNVAMALTQGYENKIKEAASMVDKIKTDLVTINDRDTGSRLLHELTLKYVKEEDEVTVKSAIANMQEAISKHENAIVQYTDQIDMIKQRLTEVHCPICITDDNEDARPHVATRCCQQKMCLECLMLWLENHHSCPLCRTVMTDKNAFHIIQNEHAATTVTNEGGRDETLTKQEMLMRLIAKEAASKVLVFSDNSDTFRIMHRLRDDGITCEVLHGTSAHVRKLIEAHDRGHINVLFLNRKVCGEGIHIPHSNALIFVHTLQNSYQYTQAIARANRFPRTTPLKVYHLLANDEALIA